MGKASYANIAATLALAVALTTGTSYAAAKLHLPKNSVGAKQLKKNAVKGDRVKDGSLTAADLAPGSFLDAAAADGRYVHGSQTSGRQTLSTVGDPGAVLLEVPGFGHFDVRCVGSSTRAELAFVKTATSSVELVYMRAYDPAGPDNTVVNESTKFLTDSTPTSFLPVDGAGSLSRFSIQLSLATGAVATVTVSLAYQDSDLRPSGCFAVGQALVG